MSDWLATAKLLIGKLEFRSEILDDQELVNEIQQAAELLRQAELQMGLLEPKNMNTVVGQASNVSKLFREDDIAFCQSSDKKVFITDKNYKVFNTCKSLKDIESTLPGLIKINQSTLIHPSQIVSIELNESQGYYAIRLPNKWLFRVSRRCYKNIKELFRSSKVDELKVS